MMSLNINPTTVLLLFFAGLFSAAMDTIQFAPKTFIFQTNWFLVKGRFAWSERTWYTKYIFTMVSDGWHCFKFLNILSYIMAIIVFKNFNVNSYLTYIAAFLIYYTLIGTAFEIGYNYLWRKAFWISIKLLLKKIL